jgi:hypothetical protein
MFQLPQFLRHFQSCPTGKPKRKAARRPLPPAIFEAMERRALLDAITIGSGPWNDPSTWQGGLVPVAGDIVIISAGHNVTYNDTTPDTLAKLNIDGLLAFDPSMTLELVTKGNIQVTDTGTLRMRPSSATQKHTITFVDVDESKFLGTTDPANSMIVLDSDVGLWVTGAGTLDAVGTEKSPWTRLAAGANKGQTTITVNDATGWRVGDQIAIAPTLDPTISKNWTTYDELSITAVSGNTITLSSALVWDHPMVNGKWTAEVMNLTRNVVIKGTPFDGTVNHRAHIEFLMPTKAQTIKNVELRYLGPKDGGSSTAHGIKGRYAIHFHHGMENTNGSLIENVVATDIGNHVFVTHASDGVTYNGTISHRTYDDAYWWDGGFDHQSHNVTYNNAIASRILGSGSTATRIAGFELGGGTGNKMINSVAVGNGALNLQSAGIEWPENSGSSVWEFHDNISHNNGLSGVFTWQNSASSPHFVTDFVAYYNGSHGISHGAYSNVYAFDNLYLYGNKEVNFMIHIAPYLGTHQQFVVQNSIIDGAGISTHGFFVARHTNQSGLHAPAFLLNNKITNLGPGGIGIQFAYDAVAQQPGDMGVDLGSGPTQWYDPPYPGPGNSSTHREWYRIENTDFGNIPANKQIFANGYVDPVNGLPYGILGDSDIVIKTLDGGVYNLRSKHFTPQYDVDFYKPTYDTAAWRWFWIGSAVGDANLITATHVSGEGLLTSKTGALGTQLMTLKQFEAIDIDQTVQIRLSENLATAGLIARRSEDDPATYYKATVGNAAGGNVLTIWKVVDGVATSLGTAPVTLTNGVNHKIRFQVTTNGAGTDLKAKVWDASLPEPGTWNAQVLNNTEQRLQKVWGDYGIIGSAAGVNPTVFDNYSSTILDSITWDANQNGYVQRWVAEGTPIVNAGPDQSKAIWVGGNAVQIDATVKDGGVLNPTAGMTYTWSVVSGPGSVTFSSGSKIDTYAAFGAPGHYTLRLVASDGTLSGKDDIQVYVAPTKAAQITETWTGTAGSPWPAGWKNYHLSGLAVAQATIIAGNKGQVINTGGANSNQIFTNTGLEAENVDITTTINVGYSSAQGGIVARQSTASPGTFLYARFSQYSLNFYMVVDGKETMLYEGPNNAYLALTDYRVRYQVITNPDGSIDMRAKVWLAGSSEPTPWTAEFTGWKSMESERYIGQAGLTGIFANQISSGTSTTKRVLFDDFTATSLDAGATLTPNFFGDTFTGASGPWSSNWTFVGPWPLTDLSGNTGHIQAGGATQVGRASYNGASFVDSTQHIKFKMDANGGYFGLHARRPASGADSYYSARTGVLGSGTANQLYLQRITNGGSATVLGSLNIGQNVLINTWYHLSFDVVTVGSATQLSAKLWKDGDPEPIAWMLSLSNNTASHQGLVGRGGVYASLNAGVNLYVDDYTLNYI